MFELSRAPIKGRVVKIYQDGNYKLVHHLSQDCKGSFCPFHNPSNHKMQSWPMRMREDPFAFPLIERFYPHGVGHPDPDSASFLGRDTTHGCDGCCHE